MSSIFPSMMITKDTVYKVMQAPDEKEVVALRSVWEKMTDWFCLTQHQKVYEQLYKFLAAESKPAEKVDAFIELKSLVSEGYKQYFISSACRNDEGTLDVKLIIKDIYNTQVSFNKEYSDRYFNEENDSCYEADNFLDKYLQVKNNILNHKLGSKERLSSVFKTEILHPPADSHYNLIEKDNIVNEADGKIKISWELKAKPPNEYYKEMSNYIKDFHKDILRANYSLHSFSGSKEIKKGQYVKEDDFLLELSTVFNANERKMLSIFAHQGHFFSAIYNMISLMKKNDSYEENDPYAFIQDRDDSKLNHRIDSQANGELTITSTVTQRLVDINSGKHLEHFSITLESKTVIPDVNIDIENQLMPNPKVKFTINDVKS